MVKHAKLSEETRVLLNKAKARLLKDDPQVGRATDDLTIQRALKKYTEGKE